MRNSIFWGKAERKYAGAIIELARFRGISCPLENYCGKLSLPESVGVLKQFDELLCIDSSLLHIARLMGIPTTSYWGPTAPSTRLRPGCGKDTIHYSELPCSPCVHIGAGSPCKGNNQCMRAILDPDSTENNPIWLA